MLEQILNEAQKQNLDEKMKSHPRYSEYLDCMMKAWEEVLSRFFNPALRMTPQLVAYDCPTAGFNMRSGATKLSFKFLDHLVTKFNLSPLDACVGIWTHEVGHYIDNPRDYTGFILQTEAASTLFSRENPKVQAAIANYFSDVALNLERMRRKQDGLELRELYEVFAKHGGKVDRLLFEFYSDRISYFKDKEKTPEYVDKIKELCSIEYNDWNLLDPYMKQFGDTILPLLKDDMKKELNDSKPFQNKDGSLGNLTEDYGKIIDQMSEQDFHNVLDSIAGQGNLSKYKRVKKFIEGKLGKKISKSKVASKYGKIAGIESSGLIFNDNMIDYYERAAKQKPLYIIKKPIVVSTFDSYPLEQEQYDISHPFSSVNPFSSPFILPGITNRHRNVPGEVKDKKFLFPDLFLSIDSSASMTDPKSQSDAVLAGFILVNNYHKNGCMIGVNNFSCDTAMLFPTRDKMKIYRMLCAYWGGGTVYDTDKVKQYFDLLSKQGMLKKMGLDGISLSNEKDYEKLLERIDPLQKDSLKRKEVWVNLKDKTVQETYDKIDHVMITDGAIFNLGDVINFFGQVSQYTRHVVMVIKDEEYAKKWKDADLKNTQIIYVDDAKKLPGIAIGHAKEMKRHLGSHVRYE